MTCYKPDCHVTILIVQSHELLPRGHILGSAQCLTAGVNLYHVSVTEIAEGSILRSDDYRLRPQYELFRDLPRPDFLVIPRFLQDRQLESAFESVRRRLNPQAPSRMTSLFAFICLDCALWFRTSSSSRHNASIVRFEPLASGRIFITDLVWRNLAANVLLKNSWELKEFPFPSSNQLSALTRVADAYWTGEHPEAYSMDSRPEALIVGDVKVRNVYVA